MMKWLLQDMRMGASATRGTLGMVLAIVLVTAAGARAVISARRRFDPSQGSCADARPAPEDGKNPVSMRTIDSTWPAPPGEESWGFVEDLKKPLPFVLFWKEGRPPQPGQVDLRGGLAVKRGFPDEKGMLKTAYADLESFIAFRQTGSRGRAYQSRLRRWRRTFRRPTRLRSRRRAFGCWPAMPRVSGARSSTSRR